MGICTIRVAYLVGVFFVAALLTGQGHLALAQRSEAGLSAELGNNQAAIAQIEKHINDAKNALAGLPPSPPTTTTPPSTLPKTPVPGCERCPPGHPCILGVCGDIAR